MEAAAENVRKRRLRSAVAEKQGSTTEEGGRTLPCLHYTCGSCLSNHAVGEAHFSPPFLGSETAY